MLTIEFGPKPLYLFTDRVGRANQHQVMSDLEVELVHRKVICSQLFFRNHDSANL